MEAIQVVAGSRSMGRKVPHLSTLTQIHDEGRGNIRGHVIWEWWLDGAFRGEMRKGSLAFFSENSNSHVGGQWFCIKSLNTKDELFVDGVIHLMLSQ